MPPMPGSALVVIEFQLVFRGLKTVLDRPPMAFESQPLCATARGSRRDPVGRRRGRSPQRRPRARVGVAKMVNGAPTAVRNSPAIAPRPRRSRGRRRQLDPEFAKRKKESAPAVAAAAPVDLTSGEQPRVRETMKRMVNGDYKIGGDLLGEHKLPVINVDGADLEAHDFGILNGKVSEAARAGDDDPLARLRLGLLDALVGGDAGADDGRGLFGVKARRYVGDVIRIGDEMLRKAAIPRIAAELRLGADRLPGRQAMLAVTAGRVEPWHADTIALLDNRDTDADRLR